MTIQKFWVLLYLPCEARFFQPQPFEDFTNVSTRLGTWSGVHAEGALTWATGQQAKFAVLPELVSREEAQRIRSLLPEQFDEDPDSVDKMLTYEFYLEKNGTFDAIATIPGKTDADHSIFQARMSPREQIAQVTRPIIQERILPFVNGRYAACKNKCTVCHSLVRRYLEHERRSHAMHFDIQALVTVVVSLNGFGSEFEGGLYVGTNDTVQFIALQTGDAVVHQSDLLHGVQVNSGERWSWIMWIKDAENCEADMSTWNRDLADAGNPVGQFLQAHRVHLGKIGQPNPGERARAKFAWLLKAAQGGFSRAQNEVGMAYKEGDGVRVDLKKAEQWFDKAASQGEGDALYNKGLLYLDKGQPHAAVQLFLAAAEKGSMGPQYNLGVAYARGAGGVNKDVEQALHWWQEDGSSSSYYAMFHVLTQENRTSEAGVWLERAGQLGNIPAMILLGKRAPSPLEQERWWRRAARVGDTDAMVELGQLLRRQGNVEGRAWLWRAAGMGNEQAKNLLEPRGIPLDTHPEL